MTKVMENNYSNDTEFEMNNTLRKTSKMEGKVYKSKIMTLRS